MCGWAIKQTAAPAEEPITLAEAKLHLRVDSNDDDTLITNLIVAAREWCEGFQNRAYITQSYVLTMDRFPRRDFIRIPRPPLQSIASVKYTSSEGIVMTIDPGDYQVDTNSEPGRIVLAVGKSWPATTLQAANAVAIDFTAGYGTASDVPQAVKQAMLLLIGGWYEQREYLLIGRPTQEVPFAVTALLSQARVVPI